MFLFLCLLVIYICLNTGFFHRISLFSSLLWRLKINFIYLCFIKPWVIYITSPVHFILQLNIYRTALVLKCLIKSIQRDHRAHHFKRLSRSSILLFHKPSVAQFTFVPFFTPSTICPKQITLEITTKSRWLIWKISIETNIAHKVIKFGCRFLSLGNLFHWQMWFSSSVNFDPVQHKECLFMFYKFALWVKITVVLILLILWDIFFS